MIAWQQLAPALDRAGGAALLTGARLPAAMAPPGLPACGDGLVAADLALAAGRLRIAAPGRIAAQGRPVLDLGHRMVWALPVDCHTHVDKGQIWARQPNPDGTFASALQAAWQDAETRFDPEDLRARAGFILDCAIAHGTRALRSHVDAARPRLDTALSVLRELAEERAGLLDVQLAPFTGLAEPADWVAEVARRAAGPGCGALSAFLYMDPGLDDFLDRLIGLAERHGLALDFHADENLDPASHCLRAVARAVQRCGFQGPVLVGHCCALSVQAQAELDETLDLAARAGLGIVALPQCNAYLMDRDGARGPRLRGHAPVHQIAGRGIAVALGSDNVRDPFHPYGDMDAVELFRDALRWMQLDHPVGDWPGAIGPVAARLIGRPDMGHLRDGGPAELMVLRARNWSEFGARAGPDRLILRRGLPATHALPDFSCLDDLQDMTP